MQGKFYFMNPPYAPYKLASLVHLHENNYVCYVKALLKGTKTLFPKENWCCRYRTVILKPTPTYSTFLLKTVELPTQKVNQK